LYAPVTPAQLDFPALYPLANQPKEPNTSAYVAVGLLGVGGFLAGAGVATAARKLRKAEPTGVGTERVTTSRPEADDEGH
jgi:hypothetical protein